MYIYEYHQQKIGNSLNEYEDSFSYDLSTGRFAMADGSTESIFSNVWSRALTTSYVRGKYGLDLNALVSDARAKWYSSIDWSNLRWFIRNKAMRGSYSTFLGISFDSRHYLSIGVGDTCLFHITEDNVTSFPIKTAKEFNNSPLLVWSGNPYTREIRAPKWIHYIEGDVDEGDVILMATDAFSQWFLKHMDERPWVKTIEHMGMEREFVTNLIESGEMKNDDVTYAFISFSRPMGMR